MVFCFVQNFFFGQNIYFFCRAQREFFFQYLTLGNMTKTLNHFIFVFLHQNQNIFFSNIGNQNIFLEKNITPPPLQVKWSFPYLCPGGEIRKLFRSRQGFLFHLSGALILDQKHDMATGLPDLELNEPS